MKDKDLEQLTLNAVALDSHVKHEEKGLRDSAKKGEIKAAKKAEASKADDDITPSEKDDQTQAQAPPELYPTGAVFNDIEPVVKERRSYVHTNGAALKGFVDLLLSYRDLSAGAGVHDRLFDLEQLGICMGYEKDGVSRFGFASKTVERDLERLLAAHPSTLTLGHYFSQLLFKARGAWGVDGGEIQVKDLSRTYANFAAQFCYMLDDVGSKGRSAEEGLGCLNGVWAKPTVITRSSKGSVQYLYFFTYEAALTDIREAKGFNKSVTGLGLADQAGNQTTRLCRLPFGVNGKKDKRYEPVTLEEFHPDRLYTPEQLLADGGITESLSTLAEREFVTAKRAMCGGQGEAKRERLKTIGRGIGGRERAPTDADADSFLDANWVESINGIDATAEALQSLGLVVADTNDSGYMTIKCPYAHAHTGGGTEDEKRTGFNADGTAIALARNHDIGENELAGYAQAGARGEGEEPHFHCFHEACKGRTTRDFVLDISKLCRDKKLPDALILRDPENKLQWLINSVGTYPAGERVLYSELGGTLDAVPMMSAATMKERHAAGFTEVCEGGHARNKQQSATDTFRDWPTRMRFVGAVNRPHRNDSGLGQDPHGRQCVNLRRYPEWVFKSHGEVRDEDRAIFEALFKHVFTDEKEALWMKQFFKMKYESPEFRGGLILLFSHRGGTGKTTIANLLASGLGGGNYTTIDMSALLSNTGRNAFDEWMVYETVVVNEGDSANKGEKTKANFARVKGLTDTNAEWGTVNPKMEAKQLVMKNFTVVITSNSTKVLHGMQSDDRRVTAIHCNEAQLDTHIAKYLQGDFSLFGDGGAAHVNAVQCSFHHWIREADMTGFDPSKPLVTAARDEIIAAVMSVEERVFRMLFDSLCESQSGGLYGAVCMSGLEAMFRAVGMNIGLRGLTFKIGLFDEFYSDIACKVFRPSVKGVRNPRHTVGASLAKFAGQKVTLRLLMDSKYTAKMLTGAMKQKIVADQLPLLDATDDGLINEIADAAMMGVDGYHGYHDGADDDDADWEDDDDAEDEDEFG